MGPATVVERDVARDTYSLRFADGSTAIGVPRRELRLPNDAENPAPSQQPSNTAVGRLAA